MPGLVELPCELILIILNYIPSRDLWKSVRLTCRFLRTIIADENYWKRKLQRRYAVELPSSQLCGPTSSLSLCCAKVEETKERWKDGKMQHVVSVTEHDGTADALALMKTSAHKRLCISGSRDRSLVIWDLNTIAKQVDGHSWKVQQLHEAHHGWIWCVCKANTDTFYSSSWDRFVKQWRIVNGSVNKVCEVEMASAVLSVINDGRTAICSTFGKKVIALDARNSFKQIAKMAYHRSAVFDLALLPDSNYLYSCSEDRRIVCVDKRKWNVVNELELEAYAPTISLREGQLACGTTDGKLLSLDPTNMTVISELSVNSGGLIRQVKLNIGSQMCITKNRHLKMFTPGLRPKLFAESPEFDAEPSRFDYYGDDLAVACGDGSIFFWTR